MALVDKGGYLVDDAVWKKMRKNLLAGIDLELRVGAFEDSKYGPENDNLQVAQVMQFNEEGTDKNPVRPFIRVGFMGPVRRGAYDEYFKESIAKIAEGKSTFLNEYKLIGKMAKTDMQEVIQDWSTPPNSPITIDLKGFNNPLIDTGTMHDSVDFKIEKRGT